MLLSRNWPLTEQVICCCWSKSKSKSSRSFLVSSVGFLCGVLMFNSWLDMGCFVLSLSDCRGITTLSVCAQVRCCLSSKVLVELCSSCETSCSVQRVRKNRLMLHSRFCLFLQLDGSLSFLKVFMSYLIGLLLCLRCKVAEHKRMFGAFFFLVSCQTHKDLLSLKRSSVMQVKRQHLRC